MSQNDNTATIFHPTLSSRIERLRELDGKRTQGTDFRWWRDGWRWQSNVNDKGDLTIDICVCDSRGTGKVIANVIGAHDANFFMATPTMVGIINELMTRIDSARKELLDDYNSHVPESLDLTKPFPPSEAL